MPCSVFCLKQAGEIGHAKLNIRKATPQFTLKIAKDTNKKAHVNAIHVAGYRWKCRRENMLILYFWNHFISFHIISYHFITHYISNSRAAMEDKRYAWRDRRTEGQLKAEAEVTENLEKVEQDILSEREVQAELENEKQELKEKEAALTKEIEDLKQKVASAENHQ